MTTTGSATTPIQSIVLTDEYNKVRSNLSKFTSSPYMTKYEFCQIIGLRVTQLAYGAIPFVPFTSKVTSNLHLRKLAITELQQNRIPFIVKRQMPNSKTEYVRVADLKLDAIEYLLED